jgi:hypothetical protein
MDKGGKMKRSIRIISIISIILPLAACIVDSSWLGLVGRWRDSQNSSFEIEFNENGTFSEYSNGRRIGFGNFQAEGDIIVMKYDPSTCGVNTGINCTVRMQFSVDGQTLILRDSESRMFFNKVSGS